MANRTFKNLAGLRFDRLLVLDRASAPGDGRGRVYWRCRCDCGRDVVVAGVCLTNKKSPTRSCGCLRNERASAAVRTHGRYDTAEYAVWEGMVQRCHNPSHQNFDDYGGRGITVCDRWRHDFAAFFADMGERPTPKHTIEREDNARGYEPGNCRWATRMEQQKNRRTSRLITFNGRTETAYRWSQITGIPSRTVTNRLNAGWPPERILTAPSAGTGFGARKSR